MLIPAGEKTELLSILRLVRMWATPQALALLILQSDLQFRRLPLEERLTVIDAALEDGVQTAQQVRRRFGTPDPNTIAGALSVPIITTDADNGYGSTMLYAAYHTKPPMIRLYSPAIKRLNRHLVDPDVRDIFGATDATAALVAHELYHHFDTSNPSGPIGRRHPVSILRIGPGTWRSGLASLAEIAAGAFAQTLLDLPFHPKLLDILVLFDTSPAAALRMIDGLAGASSPEAGIASRDFGLIMGLD